MCEGDGIMKIKRVRFHGFGHWIDRTFTFHDGINLIEAPNEAGKSTLIQGIFALLYGRNKEGNYKKKQKAVWFEQFIPWDEKNVYGGEIDYIVNHEIFRLIRSFHDDDQQLVKWKTGEDITESFAMDQKKERLFLESQIGLSGEMMKSICFIPFVEQSKPKDLKQSQLAHKLTSLMRQGEELNVYSALQFLQKQIQQIGSKQHASNTPYGQAQKKIKELEQRIEQLQQIQTQVEHDEGKLNDLIQKEKAFDNELKMLRKQKEWNQYLIEWDYLQLQKKTYQEKLDRLAKIQSTLANLQMKQEQIHLPAHFSEEELEKYMATIQHCEHLEQKLQEHHQQIIECRAQLDQFTSENDRWIQLDLGQAQQMIGLLDRYQEMEEKVNDRCSQLLDQTRYQQAEHDIEELKKLTYAPSSQTMPRFWLVVSVINGFLSLGMFLFHPFISATFALLGMGSLFVRYAFKRNEKKKNEKRRQLILDRWKVDSVFELYRRQEEIEKALKESDKEIEQEMEHIRQQVKQWMSSYQDQPLPFDPDQWKRSIQSYIQKAKEKKKWLQNRESRLEYLQEEKQRIRSLLYDRKEQIKREKEQWGTDRISELLHLKQQFEMNQHLQSQIDARKIELNANLQKEKVEKWKEKCKQIDQRIYSLQQNLQGAFCLIDEKHAVDREKATLACSKETEYLELKREIANLRGSLLARYQQLEELSDLEMERKKWLERLKQLDQEREVLQLAYQTLEEARKRVEENIAPRLKPFVSKWISQITKGRYQECNILPDHGFDLYFFEPKTGKSIPVSHLSRGTIDQMYFALRLAIIQFYSEQRKGTFLPLFLDDSFAHFDDMRLRAILKILNHFSKTHQIFLCTCHDRERRIMEKEGISYRVISLSKTVASSHNG